MGRRGSLFLIVFFFVVNVWGGKQEFILQDVCSEFIEHTYYTVCYDDHHRQARWVKHTLTYEQVSGKQKRTNNYRKDPYLSDPVLASDYRNSGYDRGHLVPAADMKLNRTSMSETFYMSNMSPQKPRFNQRIWAAIEWDMRGYVFDFGTAHVITGPLLHVGLERIRSGVTVPQWFYKIAYFPEESMMKAYLIENEEALGAGAGDFLVTVNEVEQMTGLDFFSELPDVLEEQLESQL